MRKGKLTIKRSIKSLAKIFRFIDAFAAENGLESAAALDITLAVEEIFTNLVKYNRKSVSNISIQLERKKDQIKITLIDQQEYPFDISKYKVYDLQQSLESRPVGGLGLYLTGKVMDHIDYVYKNKQSVITMIKKVRE
jgi:serine/threonine-protein kinase RsbW